MLRFSRRGAILLCSIFFAFPVVAAQEPCDQGGLEFQLQNPTLRKRSMANFIACARAPIAQSSKILLLEEMRDHSLQSTELVKAVSEWIDASDLSVQYATLKRLSEIGRAAEVAIPRLQKKLEGDAQDRQRGLLALAIGGAKDWSLDALRAQLGSAAIARKWVLGIAGARAGLQDKIIIDGLLEALGRETGPDAVEAARHLKPLPPSVRTRLLEGLAGPDPIVAAFSARGLSESGQTDRSMIPLLKKLVLKNSYAWVEPLDAWRVFGLTPPDVSEILNARSNNDLLVDPIVRIGTAAIPALLTMSTGNDPRRRTFAAACLIKIPGVKENLRKRALAVLSEPQDCPQLVGSCNVAFKGVAGASHRTIRDFEDPYASMTALLPKMPAELGIVASKGDISLSIAAPDRIFAPTDTIKLRVKITNTSRGELLVLNPSCSPVVPIAAKLNIFKEPGWPMPRMNHTMLNIGLAGDPPPPEHYSTRLKSGESRGFDCTLQEGSFEPGWTFDYHRTGENPPIRSRLTSGDYRVRVQYSLDQNELNALMSSNTLWGFKGSPWLGEAISDEAVVRIR